MKRRIISLIAVVCALALVSGVALARYGYSPKNGRLLLGPSQWHKLKVFKGFYDGHLDLYVNTDVSVKSQTKQLHANYAPLLAKTNGKATSPMYLVKGPAATGQRAVFGSEPPDAGYSPLWQEFFVRFKAGVKPILLTSDTQITAVQRQGKLTLRPSSIVLNAPITKIKVR